MLNTLPAVPEVPVSEGVVLAVVPVVAPAPP